MDIVVLSLGSLPFGPSLTLILFNLHCGSLQWSNRIAARSQKGYGSQDEGERVVPVLVQQTVLSKHLYGNANIYCSVTFQEGAVNIIFCLTCRENKQSLCKQVYFCAGKNKANHMPGFA